MTKYFENQALEKQLEGWEMPKSVLSILWPIWVKS